MFKKFFIYSFNIGIFNSIFIIATSTILFKVLITNPSLILINIIKYLLFLISLISYIYITNEFKNKTILKIIFFSIILLTNSLSFSSVVDSSFY